MKNFQDVAFLLITANHMNDHAGLGIFVGTTLVH